MDKYIMYLRKSRADKDFTDEDVMQTLSRHKRRLNDYCKRIGIVPETVLYELESADSITARPEMMKLLNMVESGQYAGVVVTDMDRLSRGSGADQALVINTFKYSNTKIITPEKTYDLDNDSDAQFAEFGMFMGRTEYKMIRKRMWNGRIAAVKEGKYVGGNPPYGYKTKKLEHQKGYSLEIVPEQAEVVKIIFDLYTTKDMGMYQIAKWLESHGYKNQFGRYFQEGHINKIISDPTYIGKVRFCHRIEKTIIKDGQLTKTSSKAEDTDIICAGLHDAIIDDKTFNLAADIKRKNNKPRLKTNVELGNPLQGILICGICGHGMRMRSIDKAGKKGIMCGNIHCKCVGSYLEYVESSVIESLEEWLDNYTVISQNAPSRNSDIKTLEISIDKIKAENETLNKQYDKVCNLFEQEIYDYDTFVSRTTKIKNAMIENNQKIESLKDEYNALKSYEKERLTIIPNIQKVIDKYESLTTAEAKNKMLKNVVEKVVYKKTVPRQPFEITVFPLLPHS